MIGWGLAGHRLDTTWAKVLRLCYQMTTEVYLFEAAATVICTVESSLSTVGRQPRQATIILKKYQM